jgi:hypothetical protein
MRRDWGRRILILGNVALAVFAASVIYSNRQYHFEWSVFVLALSVVALAVANITFISAPNPPIHSPGRMLRLFSLWLAAKEKELNRRSGADTPK